MKTNDVFEIKMLNSERLTADLCTLVRVFKSLGFRCSDVTYQSEVKRGLQLIEFSCEDMQTAKRFAEVLSHLGIHFCIYNDSYEQK